MDIETKTVELIENTNLNKEYKGIIDQIKKHYILFINFLIGVGGLIHLAYFIRIDYVPTLKVEEVLILFILSGFIGLGLIVCILFYLLASGLIYGYYRPKRLKGYTYSDTFSIDSKLKVYLQFCPLMFILFAFLGLLYAESYFDFHIFFYCLAAALVFILVTFGFFYYASVKYSKKFKLIKYLEYIAYFAISLVVSIFVSFIISYALLQHSEMSKNELEFSLFLISFMIAFNAIGVASKPISDKVVFGLIFFISISIVLRIYHVIPFSIMKAFGTGQVKINTLHLNKTGCEAFKIKTESDCKIKNVNLVWRVGDKFIVEKIDNSAYIDKFTNINRYYLNSSDVISWMINKKYNSKVTIDEEIDKDVNKDE